MVEKHMSSWRRDWTTHDEWDELGARHDGGPRQVTRAFERVDEFELMVLPHTGSEYWTKTTKDYPAQEDETDAKQLRQCRGRFQAPIGALQFLIDMAELRQKGRWVAGPCASMGAVYGAR